MSVEEMTVLTNWGIIIVTIVAIMVTAWAALREAKESHRHEEHQTDEMAAIVKEVLDQEKAEDKAREAEAEANSKQ